MSGAFTLREVVEHARAHSPFYAELYRGLGGAATDLELEDLPVVEQAAFWAANSMQGNRLLTGPLAGGVVYKSGGTTGNPKFSVFSRGEWEAFCAAFGRGLDSGGLRDGDRVANLFYAGELYASFLFITKSLESARAQAMHFPVTGASDPALIAKTVSEFGIDTLAGVPTTLLAFAQYLAAYGQKLPSVRRILFGGESMYADQREIVRDAFPGAEISSIGYASVDAGLLGFADPSCGPEEHRVFDHETILEILDEETGAPIRESGRAGKVVLTNLTRKLMPVIRYPVGDRAMWVEPEGTPCRKFVLQGRSEEAARVGPVSLYYEDLRAVIAGLPEPTGVGAFQMELTHEQGRDRLTVRVAVADPRAVTEEQARGVVSAVYSARPTLQQAVEGKVVHPIRVEWVAPAALAINARTGKLRRVVDLRR
jgi:phenylacetate-CoA ligase